ncbi:MAG: hypothetical protein HY512_00155 [Candidatus Aenigmarchaeota archaeon]|nr:hypothetical protein [Candidatus Aenigmarchaeota archaeon]
MGIYHPCKVLKVLKSSKDVIASDTTTQVIVEAWDELQWTISLDQKLNNETLNEGDVVLGDWSVNNDTKAPNMNIIKVFRGKKGDEVWKTYKEYLKKQKNKAQQTQQNQQQQAANYMG